MATPMSAPDAAILLHQPSLDANLLASTSAHSGRSIEELYDVQLTVDRLCYAGSSLEEQESEGRQGSTTSGVRKRRGPFRYRFRRVALQFPDEILPDSVPIYWALKREVQSRLEENRQQQQQRQNKGAEEGAPAQSSEEEEEVIPDFYILADTSYGK